MEIVQLVPQIPPAINGLGDYGLNLARQLRQDFGIETRFLITELNWASSSHIEGFPITQIAKHSAVELVSILVNYSSIVLLHYVGYGYAKRGCPAWLVEGLEHWKDNIPNSRLVTMFHEIYASGPPWTSAFWLSGQQKKLAARLVELSDRCLTSRQDYAALLSKLSCGKTPKMTTLPVFSNVGEPKRTPQLVERARRLVIFGNNKAKLLVYNKCSVSLQKICKELEIQEICDIGIPTELEFSQIIDIPVNEQRVLEAKGISEILLNSIASFSNFPSPAFFAKSGVFAAYCAHRLLTITAFPYVPPTDELQSGIHYWSVNQEPEQLSLEIAQTIADHAYSWYQNHSLSIQANFFAACFTDPDGLVEEKL